MSKLEEAIKEINKKCKINVITTEASGEWEYDNKIPFTSPCLNWSLYGGIPLGILLQIAGGENGGKTTLSMSICGQAQRQFKREYEDELAKLQAIEKPNATQKMRLAELLENGQRKVLWCDAESTFDEEWAVKNGMEMSSDSLYFFKPAVQSAESIFDIIRQLAETGVFGLIVLDSIGVLQSAKDLTSSYDDLSYGGIAKTLGRFSKDMVQLSHIHNLLFIGINQLRDNLRSQYYSTMSVGGRAWRHNISLAIELRKGRFLDNNYKELTAHPENAYGNVVECEITKNKICKPDRRLCKFTISYDNGLDAVNDTFNLALALGIIEGTTWYSMTDDTGEPITYDDTIIKFQGKTKFIDFMKSHEDFTQSLITKIEELTK